MLNNLESKVIFVLNLVMVLNVITWLSTEIKIQLST